MSVAFSTGALILSQEASAQQVSAGFQIFYDELSPYGLWIDYPNYGYVWIPKGYPGFCPYGTAGHWVMSENGWTWDSDYPWGWAPFHYGRWDFDKDEGWFWIPGNEWGPGWVLWNKPPGHYRWTPLKQGDSLSTTFGSNFHGRDERWIFLKDEDSSKPDMNIKYTIKRSKNIGIIDTSTIIVNAQKNDNRNSVDIAGPRRIETEYIQAVSAKSR